MRLNSAKELKELAVQKITEEIIIPYAAEAFSMNEPFFPPAVGIHPTGKGDYQLAIHLAEKSHRFLIESVETLAKGEVNVQVTGPVYCQNSQRRQIHYIRPLSVGISISHCDRLASAGTLGCFVRKRGQSDLMILSNNHVLANYNSAIVGDLILQPAHQDGGHLENDCIASLKEYIPLETTEIAGQSNLVDAAIASVTKPADVDNVSILPGIGALKGFYTEDEVAAIEDLFVAKIGRTTGLTRGRINAFDMERSIIYKGQPIAFNGLFAIEGLNNQAFSDAGDSGSLIVDSLGYAIALLVAGTKKGGQNGYGITYASPIETVFNALDVDLALN